MLQVHAAYLLIINISTRLFSARPATVSFDATGLLLPKPFDATLSSAISPTWIIKLATV